jgi:hypothetical protein
MACIATSVMAQENEPDFDLIIENMITMSDEEYDLESLTETIHALYDRPIDLNTASRSDMQAIPFLSEDEIEKILIFRNEYGLFLSKYELYMIEGLDSSMTNSLLPFIRISNKKENHDTLSLFKNIIKTSRKSLILRYSRLLQDQKGYINRKNISSIDHNQYFAGTADYIYGRLEIHELNDFDIGLTFEKDAGEAFFIDPAVRYYGFDHYAGYFRLLNRGILRQLTVGDFQMHFGEGLVLGRGFVKKGSETIGGIRNRFGGSHPFQGASESGFFRGVNLTMGDRFFNCTGFASRRLLDAKMSNDTIGPNIDDLYVTSLSTTGYHRTPDEIYSKGNLTEYTLGFNSQYTFPGQNLTFGATIAYNFWAYPIRKSTYYYNQFNFSGMENHSEGFYYNFYKGKVNVFGEIAKSMGTGYGIVQGIIANILSNFETALHIRYYSPGFFSKYGKSFAEFSGNNNERGIYWGFKIMPIPHLEIRGYFDMFRSDWPRYNIAAPSTGNEIYMNIRFQQRSTMHLTFTFKQESKYRNDPYHNFPVLTIIEGKKRNYQFNFNLYAFDRLKLQTRIKGSSFRLYEKKSIGYCFAQDIAYDGRKFKIKSRIAYFYTDDYFNRQYLYEHDVLYAFTLPAYNGHGLRMYVLVKYSPVRNLDLWLKASQYHYFDLETIGSGLSSIFGNKKTEIKCQIRIKF